MDTHFEPSCLGGYLGGALGFSLLEELAHSHHHSDFRVFPIWAQNDVSLQFLNVDAI